MAAEGSVYQRKVREKHRRQAGHWLTTLVMLFYFIAFLQLALRDLAWQGFALAVGVPAMIWLGVHALPRIYHADTLLLWGNEDKWHPTDMSNMFRAVMPKVNYTLVRNAGHLAHEEKAERIAQLIKLFIPCGYDEEA